MFKEWKETKYNEIYVKLRKQIEIKQSQYIGFTLKWGNNVIFIVQYDLKITKIISLHKKANRKWIIITGRNINIFCSKKGTKRVRPTTDLSWHNFYFLLKTNVTQFVYQVPDANVSRDVTCNQCKTLNSYTGHFQ